MRSPCVSGSADAIQAAGSGHTILDLADENFIGEIHEQPVFQHTGNVVDGALEGRRVVDTAVHLHVEHKIALISDHWAGLALGHPQLSRSPEIGQLLLNLSLIHI